LAFSFFQSSLSSNDASPQFPQFRIYVPPKFVLPTPPFYFPLPSHFIPRHPLSPFHRGSRWGFFFPRKLCTFLPFTKTWPFFFSGPGISLVLFFLWPPESPPPLSRKVPQLCRSSTFDAFNFFVLLQTGCFTRTMPSFLFFPCVGPPPPPPPLSLLAFHLTSPQNPRAFLATR